jgi:hypothetical protein
MKLFFAKGEHPEYGGHYEATIAAESIEEARVVLADYQQHEYGDVIFDTFSTGAEIPTTAAVLTVSESGV